MERAALLCESHLMRPENLPERIWSPRRDSAPVATGPAPESVDFSLKRAMRELEELYIKSALRRTRGNRTRAAEILEISQRALLYKIKEYGIDPDQEAERA